MLLALIVVLLAPGSPLVRLVQAATMPPAAEALPGECEVKALAAAWSDRVAEAALRDGEWMLRVDDAWYAWAHGRLMPEAERSRWEDFAALPFYRYPLSLPPLAPVDDERAAWLRQRVRGADEHPPRRHEEFLERLLRAGSRAETEARLVAIEVAGFTVTMHERLKGPLGLVSEELHALRRADPIVDAFLRALREMNGYNYRYVEGTRSRSFHSYGLALDLIPRSYGGKQAYWQWAMSAIEEWWTIPYEKRWMMPAPVVETFERHGFVWGGKWLFFDTMHFEYRPEILLLAREQGSLQPAARSRSSS